MIIKILNNGGSSSGGGSSKQTSQNGEKPKAASNQSAESQAANKPKEPKEPEQPKESEKPKESKPKEPEQPKAPKNEPEETPLPELEAEETLVWNVKTILDELKKFKKNNPTAGLPYDTYKLKMIRNALLDVDLIVWDMYAITRDDLWFVWQSGDLKNKEFAKFIENRRKLADTMSELMKESKNVKTDFDSNVDTITGYLEEIDKSIKGIEDRCKKGMKLCKEKRKLEKYKKEVPNIDNTYRLLNGILKNLNVVCKNLQSQFVTLKSLFGNFHVVLSCFMPNGMFGLGVEQTYPEQIEHYKKKYNYRTMFKMAMQCVIKNDSIDNILCATRISDSEIGKSDPKTRLEKLNSIRKTIHNNMEKFKKGIPECEKFIDEVGVISEKRLNLLEALLQVDVKTVLDKRSDDVPEAKALKDYDAAEAVTDLMDKYMPEESK